MIRPERTRITAVCIVAVFALFLPGCSKSGGVGVTEKDFSITLDESSAPAGDVTFNIQNDGPSTHEFVVFKSDLDPASLPTIEEDGQTIVDESGEGIEAVDEVEDVAADSSADLTVTLDAGKYVIICNLPGHYDQGMHTGFTAS
jgi:uncharacterized cupredoxin-like copper-binding protein